MNGQLELGVRPPTSDELGFVAKLWRESALAMDESPHHVPAYDALRERISTELKSGWELQVAVLGCHIVGMLAIKRGEAWLDQIFVAPGKQGKGIGKALLNVAKELMPGGFQLRMAASNLTAARFYNREGLKPLRAGVHPRTGVAVVFYGWNCC